MDETTTILIEALRDQVLKKGYGGMRGLALAFKSLDIDFSKRIVFEELKIGIESYGIRMSEGYLRRLFHALDKDNSGGIDFLEFMKALEPPMKHTRMVVINEAFDKLDVTKDDVLNVEDLRGELKVVQFSNGMIFIYTTLENCFLISRYSAPVFTAKHSVKMTLTNSILKYHCFNHSQA